MGGLRKGETAELIGHLQAQGARVEGRAFRSTAGKPTTELRFPVKVFPPNGSPMFTIHQTVGDRHQRTVLDGIIRRAGMQPPGPVREKKKAMSTDVIAPGEPMQHVRVPPAVSNRHYPPLEENVQRFLPYLEGMPETFWTDELVERLQDVTGYRGTAGPQHAIEMLDWVGYRVVEAKPNRAGFSYRWAKDPNAEVRPGVSQAERVAKMSAAMKKVRAARQVKQATVTPIVPQGNGRSERPVDTVAKADYEALEAMALETERKLAEVSRGKDEVIAQRDTLNARLSELERERDQLRKKLEAEQDTTAADDSWLLTEDDLDGDMTLIELMAAARRMRVAIEIRARKA